MDPNLNSAAGGADGNNPSGPPSAPPPGGSAKKSPIALLREELGKVTQELRVTQLDLAKAQTSLTDVQGERDRVHAAVTQLSEKIEKLAVPADVFKMFQELTGELSAALVGPDCRVEKLFTTIRELEGKVDRAIALIPPVQATAISTTRWPRLHKFRCWWRARVEKTPGGRARSVLAFATALMLILCGVFLVTTAPMLSREYWTTPEKPAPISDKTDTRSSETKKLQQELDALLQDPNSAQSKKGN